MSTEIRRPEIPAMRKCLRCNNEFESHGPGNRICNKCHAYNKSIYSYSAHAAQPCKVEHVGNMGPKGVR